MTMTELLPLEALASVFLRADALEAGYKDREIASLVRGGEWHRLRRGAYVLTEIWQQAGQGERHALMARAVVKQAKTDGVLSHVSALPEFAAPLWNLQLDTVHLTRRDQRSGRAEAGVRQHRGLLLPEDVCVRRGVEVTSATRTAIDITTVTTAEASLAVVNHLLHAALTTVDEIRARYAPMERNPFTLRTDLVLRLADGRIESVGESRFFFQCYRAGLPAPEPQYVICDTQGREVARLDFAWPEHRLWIEFDGRAKYTQHARPGETVADVVLREKRREDLVRELTGWRCIRVTWADLENPARLFARIRAALPGDTSVA